MSARRFTDADRLGSAITFSDYTKALINGELQRLEEAKRWKEVSVIAKYAPWYARSRIANNKARLMNSGLYACVTEFGYIDEAITGEFSRISRIEEFEISEFVEKNRNISIFQFDNFFDFVGIRPIYPLCFHNTLSERAWYLNSMLRRMILSIKIPIYVNVYLFLLQLVEHFFYLWTHVGIEKINSLNVFFLTAVMWLFVCLFSSGVFSCFLSMLFPPQAARRHNQALGIA